jgi:type VI secretion system protein ImpA
MSEEIEVLCAPVAGEHAVGRDLELSLELNALETAIAEPEEPSIAGVSVSDQRDWAAAAESASTLLEQSKDLRVAVIYTRALLHTRGLAGFAQGLGLTRLLLERYWPELYPKLDEDGDALARLNSLGELWSLPTLAQLRAAQILSLRNVGSFTVNDVLVVKQSPLARGSSEAAPEDVRSALEHGDVADLLAAAQQARAHVQAMAGFVAQAAPGQPVDTSALAARSGGRGLLDALVQALAEHVRSEPAPEEVPAAEGRAVTRPATRTRIESRDDVVHMLERICEFYARNEPSSPVPLLLGRVKRLVPMDFLAIVRELADKGIPQLDVLLGHEREP